MMTARMSRPPAAAGSTAAASAAALDSGVLASGPTRILQEYGHLIDPLTGLVPELRREPSSDQFQYAFGSGPNRTIRASTLDELKARARVHSGGRGVTEDEAKAGALCEAIERHCGTRHGDEVVISGTYRDLADEAIHPAACLLFDQRQYAERSEWNGAHPAFHRVPAPFDESAVIEWTPVWSLATGERRLLPTSMLYYCAGPVPGSASVLADSNGCAAGASMPDAIVRGFLELVERDAVALWWYNQTRQPAVPLSAFDDPWIAGLTRRYRTLGRDIWLLDVTSDLGIPVLVAVSRRVDGGAQDIVLGFGAHPDPQVAARRALTEAGQLLGQFSDPAGLAAWRSAVTVARQPCLLPDESAQPTLCIPALCTPTTGRESGQPGTLSVADLTSRARNTGLDVFVLDQTRPDIGLPVARVIVPGLRHFWPRFAPGRLYDVPVRLGRLARPTEYAALNPCPLPT
jgi:ribosomal protein S12 methylthiotransferase accessory factor